MCVSLVIVLAYITHVNTQYVVILVLTGYHIVFVCVCHHVAIVAVCS